ncbi:MAG: hypothetical protein GC149_18730 [Gammaproteobacteria bacterium]|nr:hypothetical protein [Gammaproteobacteria bacterium]
MEIGEGQAVVVEKKEENKKEKTTKIRLSLFFDGTLNNRTNINIRLVSAANGSLTDEERAMVKELKGEMLADKLQKAQTLYKKYDNEDSFLNGYTNIAKLEKYIDSNASSPYDFMLSSYVEGAGTRDEKGDRALGYGLGVGATGVRVKVNKGLIDAINKICKKVTRKDTVIELLTLDVFGFSRGAATARSFIYSALLEEQSIKVRLENRNYKVDNVEVKFAGLYDTVSSHGLSFSDDTQELHLDAVSHVHDVVHLAAADEHRENFSLTTIKSANGTGREIFLPGVHSDVGGSYRDGVGEDEDIFWTMSADGMRLAEEQVAELINAGWYNKDELKIKQNNQLRNKHTVNEVNVHASRKKISNMYSRIPLHVMLNFAKDSKLKFTSKIDRDQTVPSVLGNVKSEIINYVNQHKAQGSYSSKPQDWHDNNRQWLCDLRHDYFHFSARIEIGNGPRFVNGRRQRMYYDG